jgi:hypothetical protein
VNRFASNHGKFNIEWVTWLFMPPHSYTQKKIYTAAKTLWQGPWRYLQKCDHNNMEREVGFAVRALILAAKTKRDPLTTSTNLSPHTVMLILITSALSSFLSLLVLPLSHLRNRCHRVLVFLRRLVNDGTTQYDPPCIFYWQFHK